MESKASNALWRTMAAMLAGLLMVTTAQAEPWSPAPWLADLAEAKAAFRTKYASLHWLEHDRGVSLDALFAPAEAQLKTARSDDEARAIFDRLARRVYDGHVLFRWPEPRPQTTETSPQDTCSALGFEPHGPRPGAGQSLPGYRPVGDPALFPAGVIEVGGDRLGVIRIPMFQAQTFPALCRAALADLHRDDRQPCDQNCKKAIFANAYDRMTRGFADQLHALEAAHVSVVMIDLTDNGGGSQWAWAAVQMVTARPPVFERLGFERGEHWARRWTRDAAELRQAAAATADPADRARLLGWAAQVELLRQDAEKSCPDPNPCAPEGPAGYMSLVPAARAAEFAGKPWGKTVFSPAEFNYRNGEWDGPTLVLVDERTGSAAENFAAILQDNHAATIIGSRTVGSGGGYTDGGTPTVLTHSGGTLILPDHAVFRADGSNEVEGVIPDVQVGMRFTDGPALKNRLIMSHLAEAIRLAKAQRAAN